MVELSSVGRAAFLSASFNNFFYEDKLTALYSKVLKKFLDAKGNIVGSSLDMTPEKALIFAGKLTEKQRKALSLADRAQLLHLINKSTKVSAQKADTVSKLLESYKLSKSSEQANNVIAKLVHDKMAEIVANTDKALTGKLAAFKGKLKLLSQLPTKSEDDPFVMKDFEDCSKIMKQLTIEMAKIMKLPPLKDFSYVPMPLGLDTSGDYFPDSNTIQLDYDATHWYLQDNLP